MSKSKKLSFEKSAERLDEIVKLLERGDAPLDQALALYEEGAKLVITCRKMLEDAEQVVVALQKDKNGQAKEVIFHESE
jgi:exodeoxyribonuclease VII small subunit